MNVPTYVYMEKREKPRTKNLRQKKRSFDDRISLLPDDILVFILSQLPIIQSVRTSILSRRWKTLWTFTTAFDFESERPRFEHWLNQALGSHQGPTLNRLRICSSEGAEAAFHLSSWIRFAIMKSVQEFQLEFKASYFPILGFSHFNSLKTLSLCYVNVRAYQVEYFLSHCPNLETLCLADLVLVENLTISSKSLVFLEISRCLSITRLVISADSLVSFKYWGRERKITIEHAPLLTEVSFCEAYCSSLVRYQFREFECVLSQLRTLELKMSYAWITEFPKLDGLKNLDKLDLKLKVWGCDHAYSLCASILKALPLLHKLSLHLFHSEGVDNGCDDDEEEDSTKKKWVLNVENCRHHCLRDVKFVGFIGCFLDFHIIRYVAKNAMSLEKMTISPCRRAWIYSNEDFMQIEEKEEARKRASRLGVELSPYTQLFVL